MYADTKEELDELFKERVMLGTDVKALFPHMKKNMTARTVRQGYIKSGLKLHANWMDMARYTNTCLQCKKDGQKTEYIGESSRSGAERLKEHQGDRKSQRRDEISHM